MFKIGDKVRIVAYYPKGDVTKPLPINDWPSGVREQYIRGNIGVIYRELSPVSETYVVQFNNGANAYDLFPAELGHVHSNTRLLSGGNV
jgi:hypothetical protein